MAKNKTNINGNNIFVDIIKVFSARLSIVKYSKDLEGDIDAIYRSSTQLAECWQSETSEYYQNTIQSKIKEIRIQEETMNSNLKKFFGNLVTNYEVTEKRININAEKFK